MIHPKFASDKSQIPFQIQKRLSLEHNLLNLILHIFFLELYFYKPIELVIYIYPTQTSMYGLPCIH